MSTSTTTLIPESTLVFNSRGGFSYPHSTFVLSQDTIERNQQLDAISALEKRFAPSQLANHAFEWTQTSKRSEWLPRYSYYLYGTARSPTIEDIWTEYQFGIDGCLSVQQLQAGWEARWRRNNGSLKTESTRRGRVTKLIQLLAGKPNWTTDLALRFLSSQFPIPSPSPAPPYLRSTRAFMDYLKDATYEIVENAMPPPA